MTSPPPVLPSLTTAIAEGAERHRKFSLGFILLDGGRLENPLRDESVCSLPPPLSTYSSRPLPSMFQPFKTEQTDCTYGRMPVRPLFRHRFAPLAVTSPSSPPPPCTGTVPSSRSVPASTSSPAPYVVSRQAPPPAKYPKKKTYDQMSKEEKRKSRACRVEGCESYIINRGLCFRHGGGKRCAEPGCDSSAKNQGLCWKHGGSTNCIIEGCTRRGKARGLCWAHGGGTQCSAQGCTTIAVSNGKCWAHGGGKRCAFDGCTRAAYERTYNYCMKHHELLRDGHHSVEV